MSTYKLQCPHCHSSVRIRTSVGQHVFLRTTYMQCTNIGCSASWVGRFEFTHELSPPGHPNPGARLPEAPSSLRRAAKQDADNNNQLDFIDAVG